MRVFPKIGVPENRWFRMENPIKMDDLGGKIPLFLETPMNVKSCLFVSHRLHDWGTALLVKKRKFCTVFLDGAYFNWQPLCDLVRFSKKRDGSLQLGWVGLVGYYLDEWIDLIFFRLPQQPHKENTFRMKASNQKWLRFFRFLTLNAAYLNKWTYNWLNSWWRHVTPKGTVA